MLLKTKSMLLGDATKLSLKLNKMDLKKYDVIQEDYGFQYCFIIHFKSEKDANIFKIKYPEYF